MNRKTYNLYIFTLLIGILMPSGLFSQNITDGNREWSIVASYSIPGKASGLAWDGTYLYSGIYGSDGDKVYQINPADGSYTLLFSNPELDDSYGMSHDGTNLWTVVQPSGSSNPSLATKMDNTGTFLEQIALPDHYMSGIACDNGRFWVCTYYPNPGTIYKVDASGGIMSQFQAPSEQPWDICTENDNLWIVGYNNDVIFKVDQSGTILEQHECENIKPSGIVYDGQYLWYVDGQLSSESTLYKVDLGGSGTPEIYLPISEYNFGNVTIGDSAIWQVQISNNGTAPLTIDSLTFKTGVPLHCSTDMPFSIEPGYSSEAEIVYKPTQAVPLMTTASLFSNDPVNPQIELQMSGHGLNSGPSIVISDESHDYESVRAGASTRWFFQISNKGDETLIIQLPSVSSPYFSAGLELMFPLAIGVLDSVQMGVWFMPDAAAMYSGTLSIESNDPFNPEKSIDLSGQGIEMDYPMGELLWSYLIDVSYDNSPKAIAPISDVSDDGVDDVIVCSEDNYIRCLNGNSSAIADVLWERSIYSGSLYGQNCLTISEDINNDGYQDVIAGTGGGDRSIIALSGKTGEIIWKHDTHEYGGGGWLYQVDNRFDYNNDGIADILAATGDDGDDTGPRRAYCLDALNGNSIWERMLGGPVFSVIGIEDATADGIPDAIAGSSNANETEGKVSLIDGNSGSSLWNFTTSGSSVWALEQSADRSGDGVKDVIAGDFAGQYYFLDATNGSELDNGTSGPNLFIRFEKLHDVNGNGADEILFAYSGTNGILVDGLTGETLWFSSLSDKAWNVARISDISGDGIDDAIIGTLYSNNRCYFLDGVNGDVLFNKSIPAPVDAVNTIPDITGDGSMEVVVGDRNGGVYCYSGGLQHSVGINERQNFEKIQAYAMPNPFGDNTEIVFMLNSNARVKVFIKDVRGDQQIQLLDKYLPEGQHSLKWQGCDASGKGLSPGIYFYQILAGEKVYTGKLIKK